MPFALPAYYGAAGAEVPSGGNDANTLVLLHCDGADGSTSFPNDAVGDPGATFTAQGDAQVDTAQQKFGTGSLLLLGSDDYLDSNGNSSLGFGTGDFTIDFWVRLNTGGATRMMYDSRPASTQGDYPTIYHDGDNHVNFFTNASDRINGTTALSTAQWYHIAVTRSGTSTRLFVDGAQEGSTYTDNHNYLNGASRPIIGAQGFDPTQGEIDGWIDEIRVSDVARWTSNFTPPTAPYS